MRRPSLAIAIASVLIVATGIAVSASATTAPATAMASTAVGPTAQPPIGHVWTIMLENSEFEQTFIGDRNSAPYLTQTLPSLGKLVVQYYGTGHSSADNYVALASGQGPSGPTQGDCENSSVIGGTDGKYHLDADGQAVEDSGAPTTGCTYPDKVLNLGDQLSAAGVSWKGYMENMDAQPGHTSECSNPVNGRTDAPPARTESNPDYKDKHNPWAYFRSTYGNELDPADAIDPIAAQNDPNLAKREACMQHVVPLGYFDTSGAPQGQLIEDLKTEATTPQYSFITPDQCHDGHDGCASNGNTAMAGADQFLQAFVPKIMASPAYNDPQHPGLIIVTFDEGDSDFACCGEKLSPNTTSTKGNGTFPDPEDSATGSASGGLVDGGGMVGAIFLSPLVTPGSVDETNQFNHYSYLRSMEDLFGITTGGLDGHGHLGYAGEPGLVTFQEAGEFNASRASGGTSSAR